MSLSTEENEKPIIFNTEEVQAILDGRKSQFRIVLKTVVKDIKKVEFNRRYNCVLTDENNWSFQVSNKYKIDDILYVRESVKVMSPPIETCRKMAFKYLADNLYVDIVLDKEFDISKKWIQRCQGIPNGCIKEMARIFLKVANVKVERLQDINTEDILKEGISYSEIGLYYYGKFRFSTAIEAWKHLWNSTAKDGYKWEDNPYVFVYEFERIIK